MVSLVWRTGVNMREFAYFGSGKFQNDGTTQDLQKTQLDNLKPLGVRCVRFFASNRSEGMTTDICIDHVRRALDLLATYEMHAIICLNDSLFSNWCVPGEDSAHGSWDNGHLRPDYFVTGEYKKAYIPHIRKLVQAFKDHDAVLMWELVNEPNLHQGGAPSADESEAFIKFARDASSAIKEIAPGQLVSTGLVNTVHVTAEDPLQYGLRLYGLPTLDAVSIHYYHHDDEKQRAATEIALAQRLNKPFYVGEFGADRDDAKSKDLDRARYIRDEMTDWRQKGAAAALVWAYNCSPHDLGISDSRAWARKHNDFDAIATEVTAFAPPPGAALVPRRSDVARPRDRSKLRGTPGQGQKLFVVVDPPITIRSEHNTAQKYAIGQFGLNDRFFADAEPFNDGRIVWRRHDQGWSAESWLGKKPQVWIVEENLDLAKRHDNPELMLPDGTLLPMPPLLSRLPIALDDQTWTQYFGNTQFAFGLQARKSRAVRAMYDYCQGLHGGIDFGVRALGTKIFAGLSDGIVRKVDDSGKVYNPGYTRVQIGIFNVTFGHLRKIAVREGDRISADTVIGETGDITFKDGSKGEPHLHFEIRIVHEKVTYIVNPLLFIPPYLRHPYTRKFPSYARHFHFSDTWTQWLTPLDQPVLKLCNASDVMIIGPRAVEQATP